MNKSTMGSLVWRAGMASSMSVSLTRDTPGMHFVSMLQFGIPHSFGFIAYTHKLVDGKVRLGFRLVRQNQPSKNDKKNCFKLVLGGTCL
jgi:hypothetical protein